MLMIPAFLSSFSFATESEICGISCLMDISALVFNLVVFEICGLVSCIVQHFHCCRNQALDIGKARNLTPALDWHFRLRILFWSCACHTMENSVT